MKLMINKIKPAHGSKKAKKVVGRGNASGHGTFSTRGSKGQRARSGGSHGLRIHAIKELIQSTPKLRGFHSYRVKPVTITLAQLEKSFNAGDVVSVATLKEKKLLTKTDKNAKITVKGELTKKLTVEVLATAAAVQAIEKADGKVSTKAQATEAVQGE